MCPRFAHTHNPVQTGFRCTIPKCHLPFRGLVWELEKMPEQSQVPPLKQSAKGDDGRTKSRSKYGTKKPK